MSKNQSGKNTVKGGQGIPPNSQKKKQANLQENRTPQETTKKKAERVLVKINPTLDYGALKSLENSTVGSFLELVNKVILVDGKPFIARFITKQIFRADLH